MTTEQASFINLACEHAGVECDLLPDYSGRGMYGKQTQAVVVPSVVAVLGAVMNYVRKHVMPDADELNDLPSLSGLREDSMGRSVVIY